MVGRHRQRLHTWSGELRDPAGCSSTPAPRTYRDMFAIRTRRRKTVDDDHWERDSLEDERSSSKHHGVVNRNVVARLTRDTESSRLRRRIVQLKKNSAIVPKGQGSGSNPARDTSPHIRCGSRDLPSCSSTRLSTDFCSLYLKSPDNRGNRHRSDCPLSRFLRPAGVKQCALTRPSSFSYKKDTDHFLLKYRSTESLASSTTGDYGLRLAGVQTKSADYSSSDICDIAEYLPYRSSPDVRSDAYFSEAEAMDKNRSMSVSGGGMKCYWHPYDPFVRPNTGRHENQLIAHAEANRCPRSPQENRHCGTSIGHGDDNYQYECCMVGQIGRASNENMHSFQGSFSNKIYPDSSHSSRSLSSLPRPEREVHLSLISGKVNENGGADMFRSSSRESMYSASFPDHIPPGLADSTSSYPWNICEKEHNSISSRNSASFDCSVAALDDCSSLKDSWSYNRPLKSYLERQSRSAGESLLERSDALPNMWGKSASLPRSSKLVELLHLTKEVLQQNDTADHSIVDDTDCDSSTITPPQSDSALSSAELSDSGLETSDSSLVQGAYRTTNGRISLVGDKLYSEQKKSFLARRIVPELTDGYLCIVQEDDCLDDHALSGNMNEGISGTVNRRRDINCSGNTPCQQFTHEVELTEYRENKIDLEDSRDYPTLLNEKKNSFSAENQTEGLHIVTSHNEFDILKTDSSVHIDCFSPRQDHLENNTSHNTTSGDLSGVKYEGQVKSSALSPDSIMDSSQHYVESSSSSRSRSVDAAGSRSSSALLSFSSASKDSKKMSSLSNDSVNRISRLPTRGRGSLIRKSSRSGSRPTTPVAQRRLRLYPRPNSATPPAPLQQTSPPSPHSPDVPPVRILIPALRCQNKAPSPYRVRFADQSMHCSYDATEPVLPIISSPSSAPAPSSCSISNAAAPQSIVLSDANSSSTLPADTINNGAVTSATSTTPANAPLCSRTTLHGDLDQPCSTNASSSSRENTDAEHIDEESVTCSPFNGQRPNNNQLTAPVEKGDCDGVSSGDYAADAANKESADHGQVIKDPAVEAVSPRDKGDDDDGDDVWQTLWRSLSDEISLSSQTVPDNWLDVELANMFCGALKS